jgi:hypothetical protein
LSEKIDFVVTWVDGEDEQWLSEKSKYSATKNEDDGINRFRSWDNLRFWFRGVERFAPWVNRTHFVTCGQLPSWLNLNHPKLNIVKHEDYMPAECLPTFNSHAIEFYMHKIKDLSDNFVYFNDDTFIVSPVSPDSFFQNGKPCDMAVLNSFYPMEGVSQVIFNNIRLINEHFNKYDMVCSNLSNWINWRYGLKYCVKNAFQIIKNKKYFSAFADTHLGTAYTKLQFETVWDALGDIISETCRHKFRNKEDVNHFIIRYWRLVQGDFYPKRTAETFFMLINPEDCLSAADAIVSQKTDMLCLNDDVAKVEDYNKMITIINNAFSKILPEKSRFEI